MKEEKIINIWAKISSIVIIPILIILIILTPVVFTEGLKKGMIASILNLSIIIFYLPLIYYAWFKKSNKKMKVFAKITTSFTAILTIGISILIKNLEIFLVALIFYGPVFYYAWKLETS